MDLLSKWKQHSPLHGDVDLEMLGPDLLASRHHGLMTEHPEGNRKNTKTLVQHQPQQCEQLIWPNNSIITYLCVL